MSKDCKCKNSRKIFYADFLNIYHYFPYCNSKEPLTFKEFCYAQFGIDINISYKEALKIMRRV